MDVDRNQLGHGTAWITPDGILFQGRYYSCRKALREGWFNSRGDQTEPKPVSVLYDESSDYEGAIYIDSEEYSGDCLCILLPKREASDTAAWYQERIRELQQARKELSGARHR